MKLPCKYGPYLLLERVSVGGMAEVYKAKEYGVDGFERTVAVKRILPHVAEDDEFIAMFKDEAKIAVQLAHGNVAQIYSLGNEQESFYIALEYIAGRDLRALFQKGQQVGAPMPAAQACYVIMKICEGLEYAHNKKDKFQRPLNIIHRDVSPPNILVSFEGDVKLIDFGVAKAAGRASRTQAGILKGKFGYMSPEQVRGLSLDHRSDVFSVGVVLFETLTGNRLFLAETDFATLEKVRAVEVPRPTSLNPKIPRKLENIVYKALAGEPEQRYQSAMELHDELQSFMIAEGMFYTRKELAEWMCTHYAHEIELEKQRDLAQASLRPEMFGIPQGQGGAVAPPRQRRSTMMMPSGGGGPPPPPIPRRAARAEIEAGRPTPRKTMLMASSTAAPRQGRDAGSPKSGGPVDAPTVPAPSARFSGAESARSGAVARTRLQPPQKFAGTPVGADDFDWDDDELETRLFEEGDAPDLPPTRSDAPGQRRLARIDGGQPGGWAAAKSPTPAPAGRTSSEQPEVGGDEVPPTVRAPEIAPATIDYDERPGRRRGTKAVFALFVAAVVLVAGGLGAYLLARGMLTEPGVTGRVETGLAQADAAAVGGRQLGGAITLNVTPPDVFVAVDGKEVVGESPFVLSSLPVGKHVLTVAKEGFLPLEKEVELGASALPMRLTLQHRDVTLVLETDPPGALVNLVQNGHALPIGRGGTEHELTRVPGARYEVEAVMSGYKTRRQDLSFSGRSTEKVLLTLSPEGGPHARERSVSATEVDDSRVKSSGRRNASARRNSSSRRASGRTSSGSSSSQAKTAVLRIGTNPGVPPAQVFVDGAPAGSTPRPKVMVAPGKHKVVFRWPNGTSSTKYVTVEDGGSVIVKGG